jgi:protein-disulfide isomerase
MPHKGEPEIEPLDGAVDHVRGPASAHVILEYGDYECPYLSAGLPRDPTGGAGARRQSALRVSPFSADRDPSPRARRRPGGRGRSTPGRYWDMHEVLYHRQQALGDSELREYASEIGLELARFDSDFDGDAVLERIRRDIRSGIASGEVMGTPTLFLDGALHRGGYDAATLLSALAGQANLCSVDE